MKPLVLKEDRVFPTLQQHVRYLQRSIDLIGDAKLKAEYAAAKKEFDRVAGPAEKSFLLAALKINQSILDSYELSLRRTRKIAELDASIKAREGRQLSSDELSRLVVGRDRVESAIKALRFVSRIDLQKMLNKSLVGKPKFKARLILRHGFTTETKRNVLNLVVDGAELPAVFFHTQFDEKRSKFGAIKTQDYQTDGYSFNLENYPGTKHRLARPYEKSRLIDWRKLNLEVVHALGAATGRDYLWLHSAQEDVDAWIARHEKLKYGDVLASFKSLGWEFPQLGGVTDEKASFMQKTVDERELLRKYGRRA